MPPPFFVLLAENPGGGCAAPLEGAIFFGSLLSGFFAAVDGIALTLGEGAAEGVAEGDVAADEAGGASFFSHAKRTKSSGRARARTMVRVYHAATGSFTASASPGTGRAMRLSTPRLDLVAANSALIAAELADAQSLAAPLSAVVPADWPPGELDRPALEFFAARYAEEGEAAIGWYHWYAIVRAAPATLVGGAGYFGPPKDGRVEIGYSVVAAAQRRGYATEIVEALVARAFEHGVDEVVAHTTDANVASTRVLARCAFLREGPSPADPTIVRHVRRRPMEP